MGAVTIQQMAQRVETLLDERLQLRGADLKAKLRHGGRILPRKVRLAAGRLADAAAKSQVPKLLLLVDEGDVAKDYDTCVRHLTALSPAGGPWATAVRVAGSVAVGLLVAGLVIAAYFWLRTA
jgi:hypothetical protein